MKINYQLLWFVYEVYKENLHKYLMDMYGYVSKPVWHIPLLCVQWKTPDDGQRNCPKHVAFHSKNKFEKLVHLVGFNVRNLAWCTVTWTSNYCHNFLFRQKWKYFIIFWMLYQEVPCAI